ncbi:bifunctional methionine sulfoxide reductase B/A protein [Ferrimonas pelagia]|uniref:Peptide methionine sulfoxide reductase MsrA n=1 Tax=Ferrimonas pelagia TaxID=1177826 RepID=A0ABP9ELB0_9GAMM
MKPLPLSEPERQVLHDKATEAPFSGRFLYLESGGLYRCRQCYAPLYRSDSKFDAGCGWPAFDDEIEGAIRRQCDADGRRTEILCRSCGGHLGHVFEGERLTDTNVRHCVNALALEFAPECDNKEEIAVFGGGCFWCLEALFQRVVGIYEVLSGYCGGEPETAHYRTVCGGQSGHIEVIQIRFDPSQLSFGQLLELFFDCHDPTSVDQQGADKGSQYRSAIFCQNVRQRRASEAYIQRLQQGELGHNRIVTQLLDPSRFYPAEKEHQDYFERNPQQPYCAVNIQPKLVRLAQKYADRIRPL